MDIVILGGGFGGVYTAMYLEKYLPKEHKIHLVNKDNYFVYQPMLSEVVGGSLDLTDTVSPLRSLLTRTLLYIREIEGIDVVKKEVILSPQFTHTPFILKYDHLVLALGNVTDFRGMPGLHEHALPFKNLADAIVIRNRLIDCIEAASVEKDRLSKEKMLTFVVGGGGFSGTEVVAELNDFVRSFAKKYPTIQKDEITVYLVHSKDRLLERELPEKLGRYAEDILRKRGVEIIFNQRLASATPEEAILDNGRKIGSYTVISSVPSSPNPLIEGVDLPKDRGRIKTTRFLQVEGKTDHWAIGDCASIPIGENETCPPTAQFAIREAKQLAKNIVAQISGRSLSSFHFKAIGMLGALGHHRAVAELFGVFTFSGVFAWVMWRAIYWIKLPGISRKLKVAFSWLLDGLFPLEPVQIEMTPSSGIMQLHFEAGEIVFREGDVGDYLYIIADGRVEVFTCNDGREISICELSKGEYFGEMALLSKKPRSATVRCKEPTNLVALRKKEFGALVANLKELRDSFERTEKSRLSKR